MISGFYNILKPTGFTSSDTVVKLRGILSTAFGQSVKIGHLGTLDPGGSGVLVVAVGNATKLFESLSNHKKTYRAQAVLGATTDTLDSYGKVVEKCDWFNNAQNLSDDFYSDLYSNLSNTIQGFIGEQQQMPPQYSAKSVNGVRAYDLARKGNVANLKSATINIYDIKLLDVKKNKITFDITCSSGTYIRSFVRDLGQKLGVPAYMSFIIRLNLADFDITKSVTLDEVAKNPYAGFISIEEYAKGLARFDIPNELRLNFGNGDYLTVDDIDGLTSIYTNNRFLGIGRVSNGRLCKVCMNQQNPIKVEDYDKLIYRQKLSLALGYFDTVHVGHQKLLKEMLKTNGVPAVFTFSENLSKLLSKKSELDLYSFDTRVALYEKAGVKLVFAEQPTKEFLSKSPKEFLDYLTDNLNIGTIVCGDDYTFGYKAQGNVEFLRQYCFCKSINLVVVGEQTIDGDRVSSRKIKEFLQCGNIVKANKLLGRTYSLRGKVEHGREMGTKIGFPTLNLTLDTNLVLPKCGVYKGRARVNGKIKNAIINIGNHPTFDDYKVNLEAHVLDFDGNVYDKIVEIFLDDYIRDVVKFQSVEQLILQIQQDLKCFD